MSEKDVSAGLAPALPDSESGSLLLADKTLGSIPWTCTTILGFKGRSPAVRRGLIRAGPETRTPTSYLASRWATVTLAPLIGEEGFEPSELPGKDC